MNPTSPEELAKAAPEDIAAMAFRKLYPIFQTNLQTLSKKSMYRVLTSLVGYPIEEPCYLSKDERKIYTQGATLWDLKFDMMLTVLIEKQQKMEAELNKPKEEKGETNG